MTRTTTKSRKWKSSALSHLLRNPDYELSHDLRELIADRLDNQVVEIKQLRDCLAATERVEALEAIIRTLRGDIAVLYEALASEGENNE